VPWYLFSSRKRPAAMALEPKDQFLVTMAAIVEELLDDHISDIC
jgi:hypothetical protein